MALCCLRINEVVQTPNPQKDNDNGDSREDFHGQKTQQPNQSIDHGPQRQAMKDIGLMRKRFSTACSLTKCVIYGYQVQAGHI